MVDRRLAVALLGAVLLAGCRSPAPPAVSRASPPPRPAPSPSAAVERAADPLETGAAAMAENRWVDAVVALRQAVDTDPDDPAATYLLAVALEQTEGVTADEVHSYRRRAHTLAGRSTLAGETATPAVALIPTLNPRPRAQPTAVPRAPGPVRLPTASPSPSPGEAAVEYTLAPASGMPSASPSAMASTEALPIGVVVQGTVVRPDEQGELRPLTGVSVRLLALGAGTAGQCETDAGGGFAFEPQEPRSDYILVIVSTMVAHVTSPPVFQQIPGQHGMAYLPIEQPSEVHRDMSWHQYLDMSNPGTYELSLGPDNADPAYCPDLQPTYDAGARSAFSSYRIGYPAFQPP